MYHCYICGQQITTCACERCGFDLSLCREYFPTVTASGAPDTAVWVLRDAAYRGQPVKRGGNRPGNGAETKCGQMEAQQAAKHTTILSWPYLLRLNGDGSCDITGFKGEANGKLKIPDKLSGMTVTGIGRRAFMGKQTILSLELPESVRTVGAFAFYYCRALQKVTLPEEVTLENAAFGNCTALSMVRFIHGTLKAAERTSGHIAPNAFVACRQNMFFVANINTTAALFAKQKGIRFRQTP